MKYSISTIIFLFFGIAIATLSCNTPAGRAAKVAEEQLVKTKIGRKLILDAEKKVANSEFVQGVEKFFGTRPKTAPIPLRILKDWSIAFKAVDANGNQVGQSDIKVFGEIITTEAKIKKIMIQVINDYHMEVNANYTNLEKEQLLSNVLDKIAGIDKSVFFLVNGIVVYFKRCESNSDYYITAS